MKDNSHYCSKYGREQDHSFSSECCGAIASLDKEGKNKVLNILTKEE